MFKLPLEIHLGEEIGYRAVPDPDANKGEFMNAIIVSLSQSWTFFVIHLFVEVVIFSDLHANGLQPISTHNTKGKYWKAHADEIKQHIQYRPLKLYVSKYAGHCRN